MSVTVYACGFCFGRWVDNISLSVVDLGEYKVRPQPNRLANTIANPRFLKRASAFRLAY